MQNSMRPTGRRRPEPNPLEIDHRIARRQKHTGLLQGTETLFSKRKKNTLKSYEQMQKIDAMSKKKAFVDVFTDLPFLRLISLIHRTVLSHISLGYRWSLIAVMLADERNSL